MRRHRIGPLAVALAGALGLAQAADAPFLWAVQGPAAKHHLAGSVHLLPPSAYPLSSALERAYTESRELVLETDPGALAAPQMQQAMLEHGSSRTGLRAEVGEALYTQVRREAAKLEVPESVCDSFKPWFCALSLGVLSFRQAGFDPALGVDQHFYRRALEDGRELRWLESPLEQLALFSSMSATASEQLLASTLEQLDDPQYGAENLVRQWRGNDLAGVAALADEMRLQAPEVHRRLLVQRNEAWMPQLIARFRSQTPTLVLVGATHLVGPDGLIARLRAAGFNPVPVPEDAAPDPAPPAPEPASSAGNPSGD